MTFIEKLGSLFQKKELGWQTFFGYESESKTRSTQELYFGIIFSCIDAIANAVSEVNWGLYKKLSNGEYEEVKEHPALSLLKHPNKLQSATDFFYLMSTHIDTNGQTFIYPDRGLLTKKVSQLYLLNPNGMTTFTDSNKPIVDITGYKYSKNGKIFDFKTDDLINVIRPNPFDQARGISTIQMARFDGTNEMNSIEMNNAFYDNGAYPGGVLQTDNAINPDVFDKLKMKIKNQYEGKKNAFRLMFLTHGFNYKQVSPSQRDMEYVEQRKLNRDQILAIFKVPKSMVAVSDAVNRATAEAENLAFARNVIKPRLELIFDKLNQFYLPMFDQVQNLEFRFENPIKDDQEFLLKHKSTAVNSWMTVNEVRATEDLQPIEGGDELPLTNLFNTQSDEQSSHSQSGDDSDKEGSKKDDEEDSKEDDKGSKKKELMPDPDDSKSKLNKQYLERKQKYINYKENIYSVKLEAQFNQLSNMIRKAEVKKAIEAEDPEEAFQWTDEKVFEKIMPEKEDQTQWQTMLLLLILANNAQIWKTAHKQMNEVYDYKMEVTDTLETFISNQAALSAKSVSDTVYKRVKEIIHDEVASGVRDLKKIQKDVAFLLGDQKEWKALQIAQTELSRAYGEAQYKAFQENHVEKVIWLAGAGACEICAGNADQVVQLGKTFPSGHLHNPVHPNCRCDVVPYPY